MPERLEPVASGGYDDPFECERERTAAYEDRLAYEREQDRLAEEDLDGVEGVVPAPPGRRVPVLTAVLSLLLVGFLFLLAGVELQKALGPVPAPPVPPAAGPGGDGGLVSGEVIAIRDRTLYIREADGRIVKVRVETGSRLAVGRLAGLSALRPGQEVVAQSTPGEAERVADSIIVVPQREQER